MIKKIFYYPKHVLEAAHKQSFQNYPKIKESETCACFYCGHTFKGSDIEDYTYDGDELKTYTALCPNCGIDAVIDEFYAVNPDTSKVFLDEMYTYFFDDYIDEEGEIPAEKEMSKFNENWTFEEYVELVKICNRNYVYWNTYRHNKKLFDQLFDESGIAYLKELYGDHCDPMGAAALLGFGCG